MPLNEKPEAVRFMEFLRRDLEFNPEPVRLWRGRLHKSSVPRSSVEVDRVRGVYVDWLIKLEDEHGNKTRVK